MFVFNRSVLAVLAPLALLLVVALWSNSGDVDAGRGATVAADNAGGEHARNLVPLTASNSRPATGR